jgi:predicted secreted protein
MRIKHTCIRIEGTHTCKVFETEVSQKHIVAHGVFIKLYKLRSMFMNNEVYKVFASVQANNNKERFNVVVEFH